MKFIRCLLKKCQRRSPKFPLAAITCIAVVTTSHAQTPTADDFNPGADSYVKSLAVQGDGKILVGGDFTTLGGQPRDRIGRLHLDGTLDSSFNPGASNSVESLAVQPDGKILVGGRFTSLGGQSRNYIGRLNADGSVDNGFNPEANGDVFSLAVQTDGKILVGGEFTTVGGQPRTNIARLNADGTLDGSFDPGADNRVYSLGVLPDGKILVSGGFTELGGLTRWRIGRLNADGSLDTTFINPGAGGTVYSSTVQADGKILLGGSFTTLDGQTRNYIGRLHADGALDSSFNPGANSSVWTLAVQADGKILAGGWFTELGGQPRNHVGRLNAAGTLDTTFNPGADGSVYSLAVQADGKILAGGIFTNLAGQARNNIGRLNNTEPATQSLAYDDSTITWLRGGSSPEVWRTSFDLSTNGLDWVELGAGTRTTNGWELTGVSLPPEAMLRARGIVTGGRFSSSSWPVEAYYGMPVVISHPASRTNEMQTLATFTVLAGGTEPLSYQWQKEGVPLEDGGNVSGAMTSALQLTNVFGPDAGGYGVVVSTVWGSVTSAVATLTVLDPAITVGPTNQFVEPGESATLTVTASGTAPLGYQWWKDAVALAGATEASLTLTNLQASDAGDYFVVVSNQYGSVTSAVGVLTVNPVPLDTEFNPAADRHVEAFAAQPDGKILVGGGFTSLGGQPRSRIGRLHPDGTLDTSFNPGANGTVYCLAVQPDGKILAGGFFTELGGQTRNYIGRLNADGTLDSGFAVGANDFIWCMAMQADGKIILGGMFTSVAGLPRNNIARLHPNGTLDGEFDPGAGGLGGSNPDVLSIAVQADGKILVGGEFITLGGQPRKNIARLHGDGTLDASYNPGASRAVTAMAVQADGKILVGGFFTTLGGQPRTRIGRLHPDGTLDSEFNPAAEVGATFMGEPYTLALQADGRIAVAGSSGIPVEGEQLRRASYRLHPDGTLDIGFNPLPRPEGSLFSAYTLLVQDDGKIIVGGDFTMLGGQPRENIGRLNTIEPATQSLTVNGSSVTWLRGGTSPEVWRTSLDVSTNGLDWVELEAGTRIEGGWQWTGLSLPPNATLRARGFVVGGYQNGSSWFVETVLQPAPVILTGDGHLGFTNGYFAFDVQGQDGQVVAVEASTNLLDWVPVHTNLIGGLGECLFYDLQTGQFPRRYYRAKLYEGELPPPSLVTSKAGFEGGQFGFPVGAVGGQQVIVEASTNLIDWLPLETNTAGVGPLYFTDSTTTNFPLRFYRAVVP